VVAKPATADLFEQIFAPADEVAAGLALLAQSPPLWGDRLEWTELIVGLRAFEERWGAIARSASWTLPLLYGLDPHTPRARVGRMGAAWLASLRAHRVIAVDDKAVTMVTRTSSRLRIFRGDGDQGAVVAWEIRT
jgi:hypothetical protein